MKKHIIITGASKGIGKALAQICINQGFQVTGTSRDSKAMSKEHIIKGVHYENLDLSDTDSIAAFCKAVPNADMLINNAGLSQIGAVEDLSIETVEDLFRTNLFGVIQMDSFYAKKMRIAGSGKIIHVSSLAAHTPVPFSSVYAATKAALDAFAFAFRNEMFQFEVYIANVFFDFVQTKLPQIENSSSSEVYEQQVLSSKMKRDNSIATGMDPVYVAQRIYKVMMKERPALYNPIGRRTRRMYFLRKFLPVKLIEQLIRLRYELL